MKTAAKGGHETAFEYGPDRMRYMRTDTATGGTTTTLYLGNVEKLTKPDGSREVRRHIDGLVIETKRYSAAGTLTAAETQYTLKDHLGSLDVITDADGAVVQELSFDPWGQRRNASTWQGMSEAQLTGFDSSRTRRGFTGHEHLDELGIVHMNGRIYDPKLARFLQADIQVQFPSLTQPHNRYSYVLNNPLGFTDSSGYRIDVFDALKIIATVIVSVYCGGCGAAAYAWIAGVGSGVQTLYYGGSFQDALVAGVTSAALSYWGATIADGGGFGVNWQTLGFAAAGGIASVLQGGKFGHGFVAAGAGALSSRLPLGTRTDLGPVTGRALARAAVGGTISRVTGGKFANGAAYGAFASIVGDIGKAAVNRRVADSSGEQLTPEQKAELRVTRKPRRGELTSGGYSDASEQGCGLFRCRSGNRHDGVDIRSPVGARVRAAGHGTVKGVFNDPKGYGHYVDIDHGGGVETRYAHLGSVGTEIVRGEPIRVGAVIGTVGTSGNAGGPKFRSHLHFEVLVDGRPIDPESRFHWRHE